jgi:RNA polymerase primary sigma factor
MASWWHEQAGRFPLLTPSQEIHLGQQVRAWLDHPPPAPAAIERRGRRARDRFVRANLRLVINFTERYRSVPAQYQEDLIQAGNLGLMRAVEKFDPARGYKFSTYAYWWIRQGIHSFLEHYGRSIRLPTTHAAQHTKLHSAILDLSVQLNRHPTRAELAERLGWTPETIERVITRPVATLSLDARSSRCETATVADAIADPATSLLEGIASAEQMEVVLAAIGTLDPRSQRIIVDQFLSPVPSSLTVLASREQCDRATVRSAISRALVRLRWVLSGKPSAVLPAPVEQPTEYGSQLGLPWLQ